MPKSRHRPFLPWGSRPHATTTKGLREGGGEASLRWFDLFIYLFICLLSKCRRNIFLDAVECFQPVLAGFQELEAGKSAREIMAFDPLRGIRGVGVLLGVSGTLGRAHGVAAMILRFVRAPSSPVLRGGNSQTAEKGFLALRFLASSIFAKYFVEL